MSPVARTRTRRGVTLAVLVVILLLLLVRCDWLGDVTGTRVGADQGSGTGGTGSEATFTIGGHTTEPFTPGGSVPLDLTLTNDQGHDLSISTLTVSLRDVSAPRSDEGHPCTVADFVVRQASSDLGLVVLAGSTHSLRTLGVPTADWPHVTMLNTPVNQDGCKGATVGLDYLGTGRRVDR